MEFPTTQIPCFVLLALSRVILGGAQSCNFEQGLVPSHVSLSELELYATLMPDAEGSLALP